ncbi:hypothetical protein EVJ27_09245 [Exiguobacterium sp. SH3S2]|uniref:hypothetical protein n=1 Tax=Exiguobacterium TaxID=33986 RepID=UPI000877A462|nr:MULTISPECIES: hypothetical protein [Exiguobacterium]TCI26852.1 hypothetical protein EVJ32_03600 [Exiguobacterium sp. SH5S4]TCI35171.1 hypothetical protein EVJ29_11045 [Exiguobacterium sp. SH4S7]TCI44513.1 hypothetical protein EVJ28_09245 [Exiguobacterium sp. SH3S3]TCI44717.1 hypothetical protein EVJ31_09870 [Exiguobacterium sp. SH5S32]TCI51124.1 hypothetical protein EVJ25_10835 [Exiguobacterium sp. SH1S4]
MVWFGITASIVVVGIVAFIAAMNRHGEKLAGDEESPPVIWADEDWYKPGSSKDDGPPDG